MTRGTLRAAHTRTPRPSAAQLTRPMRTFSRRAALALLLSSLTLACASRRTDGGDQQMNVPTTLRVENQAFLDMTIYVVRSGQRYRLGVANGNSTARFVIPASMVGGVSLSFLADPIGSSRTPVSQEIVVTPGDEVMLFIPPA